jgi:hypothetical protein
MLVKDFFLWAKNEFMIEMELMKFKGQEYTVSDDDKLANFKSIAERLKCKPEFVAMVYLLKHMDSVRNYVLEGTEASNEPIEGRLRDIRNYCLLLGALIKERKEEKKGFKKESRDFFKLTDNYISDLKKKNKKNDKS